MNKELEDFKNEMYEKLKTVTVNREGVGEGLENLLEELKPKPEFIGGEIVEFSGDGKKELGIFSEYTGDDLYPYEGGFSGMWSKCKKLEALPMNMTVYNGSGKYPYNVGHGTLVFVRIDGGRFRGGIAEDFNWGWVAEYQILKDLKT